MRWTKIGLPIFVVVVGVAASMLPGLDDIHIDPDVFLRLFIPPLLLADATGLVAFKLAVAAAAASGSFSTSDVAIDFIVLSGGGVCVGVVVEWLGRRLRERLIVAGANDPVLQTLLGILVPYAAYLVAEALHVSGVLAVVIAGLWAGGKEVRGLSAEGRRHAREVWRMIS